ncbi:alpha/beta fold hydrolase [Nonomuraea typhae]|uniref:Alpha/beta fold hydrolase n=1 Tax=Nonomuraea typhae TaxID=2603600 RepID=A0ABW7ZCE8_9ACTN
MASLPAAGVAAAGSAAPAPRLTGEAECKDAPGFTCSMLTVPLDHTGRVPGELKLQVAADGNVNAPKGILLILPGGPAVTGVQLVAEVKRRLAGLAKNYRFVMLDQRGTGEFGAINCPGVQRVTGSDIMAPTPAAVRECAAIIGPNRRFYRVDDAVADLDLLRRALGARRMTLNGISYDALTAARYALAHPRSVNRLVLDAVWPYVDPQRDEPLYLTPLQAHRRVLGAACALMPDCDWDPVKDLAWLVRTRGDGVTLLDVVAGEGFKDPTYTGVIKALHKARHGDPTELDKLIADIRNQGPVSHTFLSFGTYTARFCTDSRFPWGDSSAPLATRRAALERRLRSLRPEQIGPYDRKTVAGLGFVQRCLPWPVTRPNAEPPRNSTLPPIPTLLLNGDRDLFTPAEWAREVAARTPQGKLVIVKGAGHAVQQYEPGEEGRRAVYAFLSQ